MIDYQNLASQIIVHGNKDDPRLTEVYIDLGKEKGTFDMPMFVAIGKRNKAKLLRTIAILLLTVILLIAFFILCRSVFFAS